METQERPPLKPADGMLQPWKDNTDLRRALLRVSDLVAAMLVVERAMGDDDAPIIFNAQWSWEKPYIRVNCRDDAHARLTVGRIIRASGKKNTVKKIGDDSMQAVFDMDGAEIIVSGYKPKTCRYEEIEVDMPAEPERVSTVVIEAKPARKEKRRVIICDETKPEPQVPEEVEEVAEAMSRDTIPSSHDVPF